MALSPEEHASLKARCLQAVQFGATLARVDEYLAKCGVKSIPGLSKESQLLNALENMNLNDATSAQTTVTEVAPEPVVETPEAVAAVTEPAVVEEAPVVSSTEAEPDASIETAPVVQTGAEDETPKGKKARKKLAVALPPLGSEGCPSLSPYDAVRSQAMKALKNADGISRFRAIFAISPSGA